MQKWQMQAAQAGKKIGAKMRRAKSQNINHMRKAEPEHSNISINAP